jgi:hypothetical protein
MVAVEEAVLEGHEQEAAVVLEEDHQGVGLVVEDHERPWAGDHQVEEEALEGRQEEDQEVVEDHQQVGVEEEDLQHHRRP